MSAVTTEIRDGTQGIARCLICKEPLTVRLARGRKSGKPFVMMLCAQNGRHFRAFITDQTYVAGVLERLEART